MMEGTMTSATWDLRATPSYSPLVEEHYTLQIYDQRGQDSLPKPGWLLPDNKMRIALYKTEGNNHVGEKIARKNYLRVHIKEDVDYFMYIASKCATCFDYVMKNLGDKMRALTNKNYANCTLMMIIFFLWTLL